MGLIHIKQRHSRTKRDQLLLIQGKETRVSLEMKLGRTLSRRKGRKPWF